MRKTFVFLLFIILSSNFSPSYAIESPAQQTIEGFLTTIKGMEFPIKDIAKFEVQAAQANIALDLEAMGKEALGNHWAEASSEQQKLFIGLFWKLIEYVAYPKSNKFMGSYQITYTSVKETEKGTEIQSAIKQEEQALDAKVTYYLYQKEGQWKVKDIILDDVSIIEDLKYQFDKLIQDAKFEGLLRKMREKLSQAQKENINLPQAA